MDVVASICAGIALAAACGFRVFLPLLGLSIAVATGMVQPPANMQWIGSAPALVALGIATAAEVAGYYIPVIDHALDTIASPAAVVAGAIAAGTLLPVGDHWHPVVRWTAAIVAGGGLAGVVQTGTVVTRAASGATTGTLGNPIVSTIENVFATVLAILAIVLPILAAALVIAALLWTFRRISNWRRRRRAILTQPAVS